MPGFLIYLLPAKSTLISLIPPVAFKEDVRYLNVVTPDVTYEVTSGWSITWYVNDDIPVVLIPKLPPYSLTSTTIFDPFITWSSGSESLFETLIVSKELGTSLYHNGNCRLSVNFTFTIEPVVPATPVLIISVEIPTPSNLLVKFLSL